MTLKERLPSIVNQDGQPHLRVMKGLELSRKQTLIAFMGLLLLFLAPDLTTIVPGLTSNVIENGLAFGFAALGVSMLLRHFYLISFGHAAFFGTAAYTIAVLANRFGISQTIPLIIFGVITATIMATIIGYLVKDHLGIYFALLTLAFNQILFAVVLGLEYFNYSDGLSVRTNGQRPTLLGIDFSIDAFSVLVFYLGAILLVVSLLVLYRLAKSPFGRALSAIGQNRIRAQFIGIKVSDYVWAAFIISGIYAGIGGAFFALFELHVRPSPVLDIFRSGEFLFMSILGGFQTFIGPIVGAMGLMYLLDTIHVWTEYSEAVIAIILIFIVYFLPDGIIGSSDVLIQRFSKGLRDPEIVRQWAAQLRTQVRESYEQATNSMKLLLFGVK